MKTTLKLALCEKCGALIGDKEIHFIAAHSTAPQFSYITYDINIPKPKVKKNVVKKEKT